MIPEKEYLKAKQIVQKYEKQLNISDVIKYVCENNEHIWTYIGTDKEKMLMINKCVKCGLEVSLPLPKPF